tara:strand:- start:43 stop:1065 length:1023 start_codon:yes stop_codon:yes gene_type:complete
LSAAPHKSKQMSKDSEYYKISNGDMSAVLIPFGASLTDLRFTSDNMPLVLGYKDAETYEEDGQFLGAVIGRYANRIAGGNSYVDGHRLTLEKNDMQINHLHGGSNGFSQKKWHLDSISVDHAAFSIVSPDGESGYTGTLQLTAVYELIGPASLRLTFRAQTDKATIINICHHPYFNFAGGGSIDKHQLMIMADHYLPSGDKLVPTGEITPIIDGWFDFRKPRFVDQFQYNNTYCLHQKQKGELRHGATLSGHGVSMELWTTQPGLHFYNGYKLNGLALGHLDRSYDAGSGLCLEAQAWPDSPNRANFPNAVLRAGEIYQQVTEYRFKKSTPFETGFVWGH